MKKLSTQRAIISLEGADDLDLPIQQIAYMGKADDVEIITPYGMHANLPNNTLMTVWPIQNQEDYRVAMGYTPKERPKEIEPGELVIYHPITKTQIYFKNNGDLDINVTGDNGDSNITIKKDLNVNISGDCNITVSGSTTIDCPTTTITGDVTIQGNLDVEGDTTLSDTVTSNSKDISDTHIHPHGVPNTGPPV